jgi:hypothetical protein
MKKTKLFFAVAAIGMMSLASCKKCADCTAYALGVQGQTQELCGDELDAAKESWNATLETGWKCN